MTIAQIHSFIYELIRKEQTGHVTHEQIDDKLHMAQIWLFNSLQPLYGVEDMVNEALSPFKKSIQFTTDAQGVYTIAPTEGAQRVTGVTCSVYDNQAQRTRWWTAYNVAEEGWAYRRNSQLNEPSATMPIYRVEGLDTLRFAPEQIHAGVVFFLTIPTAPKFAYTMAGRVITQDTGTSINLKWKEQFHPKIILKAIELLGIKLDQDRLVQLSDALIKDNA
jgi:hypothetical protein